MNDSPSSGGLFSSLIETSSCPEAKSTFMVLPSSSTRFFGPSPDGLILFLGVRNINALSSPHIPLSASMTSGLLSRLPPMPHLLGLVGSIICFEFGSTQLASFFGLPRFLLPVSSKYFLCRHFCSLPRRLLLTKMMSIPSIIPQFFPEENLQVTPLRTRQSQFPTYGKSSLSDIATPQFCALVSQSFIPPITSCCGFLSPKPSRACSAP